MKNERKLEDRIEILSISFLFLLSSLVLILDVSEGNGSDDGSGGIFLESPIFVSGTGSDLSGNGTIMNPYRTIGKAHSEASNGDVIFLLNGNYSEDIYISKEIEIRSDEYDIELSGNLTIESSGKVLLRKVDLLFNGNGSFTCSVVNNGIMELVDSNFSSPSRDNGFSLVLNSKTRIFNCRLTNLWQNSGASWWSARGLQIFDDDVIIENSTIGWEIRNISDTIGTAVFITNSAPVIRNTTIVHCDRIGVLIDYSSGVLIENCSFENSFQGIYGHRDSSYTSKRNTFSNLSADAVTCETNVNAIIENSSFIDCYTKRYYQLISGDVEISNTTISGTKENTSFPEILVGNNCNVVCSGTHFGWGNISIGTSNSTLEMRNYLSIHTIDHIGANLSGVDVKVLDNNRTIYSSSGYGGSDPRTDAEGNVDNILVVDRIYKNSDIPSENTTNIHTKYNGTEVARLDVNMSRSHSEEIMINTSTEDDVKKEGVDLYLTANDISSSSDEIQLNSSTTISAVIHNGPVSDMELSEDLIIGTQFHEKDPSFSPASDRVLYNSDRSGNDELWVFDMRNGTEYQVTDIFNDLGKRHINGQTWSHNGKMIYFAVGNAPDFDIYSINTDGTGLTFITDHLTRDGGPVASPDGKYIYFTSDPNWSPNSEIVRVDVDGTNKTVIRNSDSKSTNCLSISEDGEYLLFSHDESASGYSGQSNIIRMRSDGSEELSIFPRSGSESYTLPEFGPEGKMTFCYRSSSQTDYNIYMSDLDGFDIKPLVIGPGEDMDTDMSSNGARMVFESDRDGSWDIYLYTFGSQFRSCDANARIEFYDADPSSGGMLIGYQDLFIPYGSQRTASVGWTPKEAGDHDIYVLIDEVVPDDMALWNNTAFRQFSVTSPGEPPQEPEPEPAVDLLLKAEDISFSDDSPMIGEVLMIDAEVHNSPMPEVERTEELLFNSTSNEKYPSFSPSFDRIAYQSDRTGNDELWVYDLTNRTSYRVTDIKNDLGMNSILGFSWNHDGSELFFAPGNAPSFDIYGVNVDGTSLRFIADHRTRDGGPVASPNGQYIYFTSDPNWTPNSEIVRVDVDGSNKVVIRNSDGKAANCLSISDNGGYLFFNHDEGSSGFSGPSNIVRIKADGSSEERLFDRTGSESYSMARAAPNGRITFSYRSSNQENFDIYMADTDGSDIEPIVTSSGNDGHSQISNDGSMMLLDTDRNGNSDIYLVKFANKFNESDANATVTFYNGDPDKDGDLIGSVRIHVPFNTSSTATIAWAPMNSGRYDIFVVIEGIVPKDVNVSNNRAARSIIVSRPQLYLLIDKTHCFVDDEIEVTALYTGRGTSIDFTVFDEEDNIVMQRSLNTSKGKLANDTSSPVSNVEYQQVVWKFSFPDDTSAGNYRLVARVASFGISKEVSMDLETRDLELEEDSSSPPRIKTGPVLITGGILILAGTLIGGVIFVEAFRWPILLLLAPLMAWMSRKDVMTQEVRGSIYGVVISQPGVHYNEIRNRLSLPNGSTAYHLHVLIKENKIVTRRDGAKRRFYPKSKVDEIPSGVRGPRPKGLQIKILSHLEEYPGQSQKELAKDLKESQQRISYNLKKLIKMGYIEIVSGKVNRYIVYGGPTAFSCPECHTQFTSDTPPKLCPSCGEELNKDEEDVESWD